MRFKINDEWYSHSQANSMMVEFTPEEIQALAAQPHVRDEHGNPVIRFASFANDAAGWPAENKQAWIDTKSIPQPGLQPLKELEPGERTKWERERLEKGLPIN